MVKELEPSEIDKSLKKIVEKQEAFRKFKKNLEAIGLPSIALLPITARIAILDGSKIIYETADFVYKTVEGEVSFIKKAMMELIFFEVRIIMKGICIATDVCEVKFK
jgi:hypothetical protein